MGAALVALALGILAIIGWQANVPALTGIDESMPSMQYNAALGIALGAVGLLTLGAGRRRVAMVAALLACLLGTATVVEYVARVDLHIDNFFFQHPPNLRLAWVGRMGMNAAICFSLVGSALALLALRPARTQSAALLAAVILGLGVIALFGLFVPLPPAYGWAPYGFTAMAPHAAIAVVALGVGLLAHGWSEWRASHPGIPPWAPIAAGVSLATFALILALCFFARDDALLRRETANRTDAIRSDIEAEIHGRAQALVRAARRWEVVRPSRDQWESEAALYITDFGGYQAISWVDPSMTLRWVVPHKGNEATVGLRLTSAAGRVEAVEDARRRHEPVTIGPIDLVQGGRGFVIFIPIFRGGEFDGCLAAVFRIGPLLDAILAQHPTGGYGVSVSWNGEVVYTWPELPDAAERDRSKLTAVHIPGAAWTLRVWPESDLVASRRSIVPHVTLLSGFLVAVLLALTLRLAVAARQRASALERANSLLTAEMSQHERADRRLRAQLAATSVLASSAEPEEALRKLLPAIGGNLGWDRGEFWALDRASDVLRCCAVWQPDGRHFAAFDAATDHLTLPVGAVLAGKAWDSGGPAWVADVAADPDFLRRDAAAADGLHAAFSLPVCGGDVAGTMSFFSREVLPADGRLLRVLGAIASQAGEFFRRRHAEEALRASEEQARLVADAIPHLVWSCDATGRQLGANSYWHDYTGQPAGEIEELGLAAALHPDDRERALSAWKEALQAGNDYCVEYRLRRASDGEYRWHLVQGRPVRNAAGRIARWVGTGTDVHDRTEAELAMQRAREVAETASRAKSEFVANVSHEVRTPLHGIIGMTRLALETHLTPEQREYLESARASAEALLGLVDEVLDFSKIEAGKLEIHAERFTLRPSLEALLKPLALRAREKGLRLNCSVAEDVPNDLVGDLGRLRQVLVNLIGNAVKFTEQGEVSIHVRNAGDDLAAPGSRRPRLRFDVSDTGIGIPADRMTAIFAPFEQADGSMARRYGGTGLGLTISQRLVALLGGTLTAESEVGRGSTFSFEIPLSLPRRSATGELKPSARGTTPGGGLRVLVAEDNLVSQRLASATLTKRGHRVHVVGNGRAAIAALEAEPFDLVLMDVQMPDMDGFEATAAIRRRENGTGRRTPIVALTAHVMAGEIDRCLAAGMDACISKPFRPEDLWSTIAECTGTTVAK